MTQSDEQAGWFASFLREVMEMPRRHALVFLIATILLVVVEIELVEGWELVHLLELVGMMVFLYLAWAAWRMGRRRARGMRSPAGGE